MAVQNFDTLTIEVLRRLSWDGVRVFLAVAAAGSFKAAAKSLNISVNTVRNHVARLEDVVKTPLLERSHRGVKLTDAGDRVSEVAREMAAAGSAIAQAKPERLSPRVKLVVTEGIGTFWIVPRIADFAARHPDIVIDLECSMTPSVHFEDGASVSVQLLQPTDPDAVSIHLGTLHLMPFAAPEYIERHGMPVTLAEVIDHRLVIQKGEQVNEAVFPAIFGDRPPLGLVALETNSSAAHYWAIAKAMGIGILPTYARAITRTIVPINIPFHLRRDLWLSYPLGAKENPAVAKVIEWMKRSFDPALYPWFADRFVHPDEFEANFEGTNVVRLFAGFMDLPAQIGQ